MYQKISLNGKWQGFGLSADRSETKTFEAHVPGCVHKDLYGDDIHKNLYWRNNAEKVQWIENWDWSFSRKFSLDAVPSPCRLVCEGLDCYCDIYVNGQKVGDAADMFIPYSFDVERFLKNGENEIRVAFRSPVNEVKNAPELPASFSGGRMYTRRTQCSYGWDWVQRMVTCGIFRDIYLFSNTDLTVKDMYVYTDSVDNESAQLSLTVNLENYETGGYCEIKVISPKGKTVWYNRRYTEEPSFREWIDIADPALWYPNGYGAQPLYTVSVTTEDKDGKLLHTHEEKIGIRTLKILQIPDDPESTYADRCRELQTRKGISARDQNKRYSGFLVLVNGVRILCRGGNWVPTEPIACEDDDAKITRFLELSAGAHVNMIRVWGGGKFESEHFYAECDRLGILVTQDFLMACATYPEQEEWFLAFLREEAKYAAKLIRNHPCLAWWSGDNENAVEGTDESVDYTGRRSALKAIGPVLAELDYNRHFLPSSPYGGDRYGSATRGTTHNTYYLETIFPYIYESDMQDYYAFFREYTARFIAEEPAYGAGVRSSILRFMTEEDLQDESDEQWKFHVKYDPAVKPIQLDYLISMARKLFGEFSDREDRYFKMKYEQYEWIRITMENLQRQKWFCGGLVYWMLNDAWPAAGGWSIIDYYTVPKAAYYSFKAAAGDIISSIDRTQDGTFNLYLCSNLQTEQAASVSLYKYNTVTEERTPLFAKTMIAAPQKSEVIYTMPFDLSEEEMLIADLSAGSYQHRSFYKTHLPIHKVDTVRMTEVKPQTFTVTADKYTHVVELDGDGVFSDNYFSLTEGESKTVFFTPSFDAKSTDVSLTAYSF